jgi:uncharacterized protein YndB with AHSA1/START domain
MSAIVGSIEIARRPDDVFAYVTDASQFPDWQESVVAARREGDAPLAVGTRTVVTRRVGRRAASTTEELTELQPPGRWGSAPGFLDTRLHRALSSQARLQLVNVATGKAARPCRLPRQPPSSRSASAP